VIELTPPHAAVAVTIRVFYGIHVQGELK